MFTIQQQGNVWVVLSGTEQVGGDHATYDDALAAISDMLGAQLAAEPNATSDGTTTGVLPERWHSTTGCARLAVTILPNWRGLSKSTKPTSAERRPLSTRASG